MAPSYARYLSRHGNVYYVRVYVPPALRPLIGQTEIRRSLGTSDRKLAARRALQFVQQITEAFESMGRKRDDLPTLDLFIAKLAKGDYVLDGVQVDNDADLEQLNGILGTPAQIAPATPVTTKAFEEHLIEDEPDKHLKRPAQSTRRVPIHHELIRLGFLQHVEKLRFAGKTRLFEMWKRHSKTVIGNMAESGTSCCETNSASPKTSTRSGTPLLQRLTTCGNRVISSRNW